MKTLNYLFTVLLSIMILSCGTKKERTFQPASEDSFRKEMLSKANGYFKVLPAIAENPENPLNEAKVKLGKILYFDKQLSKEGNISCNSCHNLNTYGVDNLPTSPGDDGTMGSRNSPTVFNAAFHTSQFWDGRANNVEIQAGMPITNPVEMAMDDELLVLERIGSSELYQELFAKAFPDEEYSISYVNLGKAIGAFERTLVTPSRFDLFLAGNTEALNIKELEGMNTFINSGCIACHRNRVLGGEMLQKFALFGNYWDHTGSVNIDKGKAEQTGALSDEFLFKVPSLRNIEKTFPYFHDGSISDLSQAVTIMGITEMNKDLSDEEVIEILTFLKSLSADIPEASKLEPEELNYLYPI